METTKRNSALLVGLAAVLVWTVGCSDLGPTTAEEQPSADKKMQILLSLQVNPDKPVGETIHNTPITYEGELFNGDAVLNSVAFRSINNPAAWDYWSFCALAGDVVNIQTHRTTSQMDPAQTLFFGTTDDSQGLRFFSSSNPDMQFLAFDDDNFGRPHGVGGRFADPRTIRTLPSDGFYTIAVYDFIGAGPGPTVPYELHLSGNSRCVVEFAEFVIEEAEIRVDDEEPDDGDGPEDRFEVEGEFVLGDANDGIDVLNEDVVVEFGGFSQTIPAGSFFRDDDDEGFQFDGTLPGIKQIDIRDDFEFRVKGRDLNLSGIDLNSPVPFSLQIGNDTGETTIQFDDEGEFELDDE